MVTNPLPSALIERVTAGESVVYPTTTLPALGCIPNSEALDTLFRVKGRNTANVVSLGVASLAQASALVDIPDDAKELLDAFPRGSLTLILPAKQRLDDRLGGDSIAIRLLAHPDAIALTEVVGPLTATSANPSGNAPEVDCRLAAATLGLDAEAVLDGVCPGGEPSTLIALNESGGSDIERRWTVLREGIIQQKEVREWLTQT